MIYSKTEIVISRPLATVFSFLQDPANYALWQLTMEHISATDGMREGSHIKFTRSSELGDRLAGNIKITKNNGRDLLESTGVSGMFDNHVTFQLHPAGSANTRFVVIIKSKPRSALPPEAEAALQYIVDERTNADNQRLKQVLEA